MTCHVTIDLYNDFRLVEPVTARVQEPDARLLALLLKPAPLSASEWAYLEAIEALSDAT